jgi:hypothetical protein
VYEYSYCSATVPVRHDGIPRQIGLETIFIVIYFLSSAHCIVR